ncbi:MAG: STAS domain-containing protein [Acidimicrobiales bacterium]
MAQVRSCFYAASDGPSLSRGGTEAGPIVVWLWGAHDASTDRELSLTLARAIALGSASIVLDMSEVELIAASTLWTIVRAREFLGQRAASLTVRSASASARRVIDACGLNDLLGRSAETTGDVTGTALSSWVAVPAAPRSDAQPAPSTTVPEPRPARLGPVDAPRAQAVSAALAETA